jgi:uncharacterized metal-binding protein YceD (DUF177 family)
MTAPMPTPNPEFSRVVRMNELGDGRRERTIEANEAERVALARRFGLRDLSHLDASLQLIPEAAGCLVQGSLKAKLVQACVATDEDVPATVEVPVAIRYLRGFDEEAESHEEFELSEDDCDTLPLEDERIDIGESVAQTLALNLNPYPRVADADERLRALGVLTEEEAGPFAALKALKLGKEG